MPKCPLYQSRPTDDVAPNAGVDLSVSVTSDEYPPCQHACFSDSTSSVVSCNGEFSRCMVQLDDHQLSDFIGNELRARRVEVIFNRGDVHGILYVDKNSWLALEFTRRFGHRQTRGIETTLTINNNQFKFSADNKPISFGDTMVFPLDLL